MRLLGVLIKRELLDNLTSSRYVLASVLCIVLCITSVILMNNDYDNRIKRHELSHNVGGKPNILDWSTADIIAKPPVPLSLISKGTVVTDGLLDRVEMGFRAYDPCFGCATHTMPGQMPMIVTIRDKDGNTLEELRRD